MKPHIKLTECLYFHRQSRSPLYGCGIPGSPFRGFGATPREAYREWMGTFDAKWRREIEAELGVLKSQDANRLPRETAK